MVKIVQCLSSKGKKIFLQQNNIELKRRNRTNIMEYAISLNTV